MEDLTGKQFGVYQIITPLGEGGMAAVYKAYQPDVDRYVALKVLPRHFASDPQFIKRFEQEARVLAKLQHPYILPIHAYGDSEGYTYMVMPLVAGGDLSDLLKSKRLSPAEIGQVISQVGDALDYAHTQGVIHRDVKPSNILIDPRGNCLLTDFGIAKLVEGVTNLTMTGGVIGTPSYMSPEQGLGQPLDGRTDIYSLGIILYEMATGQVPFRAETPMAAMLMHMQEPPPPPSKVDPTIPEVLERVILKSLAKAPEDRYASPGDMVKALQSAIQSMAASQPTQPRQAAPAAAAPRRVDAPQPNDSPQTTPSAAKFASQNKLDPKLLWGLIGLGLVVVIGITLLGILLFNRPDRAAGAPPPPPQVEQQPDQPQPGGPQSAPPANQNQPAQPPAGQTQPPAGAGQPPAPPPEAIEACRGAVGEAQCTVNLPGGPIQGLCRPSPEQLACIPTGNPPPGR